MKTAAVTVVRVYFRSDDHQVDALLKRLRDWEKVRGVSVFTGSLGFGESIVEKADGSSARKEEEPTVIEFFDDPQKVETMLAHIASNVKPRHMVWWPATVHLGE